MTNNLELAINDLDVVTGGTVKGTANAGAKAGASANVGEAKGEAGIGTVIMVAVIVLFGMGRSKSGVRGSRFYDPRKATVSGVGLTEIRQIEPAGVNRRARKSQFGLRLRLAQAQANGRGRPAFGAVSRAATRAEYRHQHLRQFAAYRTVGLNGSNSGDACVTLVPLGTRLTLGSELALCARLTLGTGRALRALRPLCAGLALRSRDALHALRPLGAGRTLRTWLALRPGILAACAKRQSQTNCEYRENPHATPPCDFRPLMAVANSMPSTRSS